ncbi:MAG: RHS repeat-associated core domain-containing protein, partial [Candidatus Angelobacter sp.]
TYNEANFLQSVNANLRGATTATPFVSNIDYNSKGQRIQIEFGNGNTQSAYTYDPLTFRLTSLTTNRPGKPANQQIVQKLSYTYDPSGNITHIQDDADIQNVAFFRNRRVEPSGDYTYDAIYRLIQAIGREQLGFDAHNNPLPPTASSYNNVPRFLLTPAQGDGGAVGTYIETYQYDAVGNFLKSIHQGSNPANPGWTRSYTYNEISLIEGGKQSNRLTSTAISGNQPLNEPYTYDLHGNIISMPQLQAMQWNFIGALLMTRRQAVNGSDQDGQQHQGEKTYYLYDAAGQRVRKTTESSAGIKVKERFYLGVFELYREYDSMGNVKLARETLHLMDDKKRVALVETKTVDASAVPGSLPSAATRYQFDNHLGSSCLELDETAAIISYEEYYPFGGTSYQAGRTIAEVSLKRYRYTGKERDEETGFYYYGARYYAPWIGRWTACDPVGLADSIDAYVFVRCNPLIRIDQDGQFSLSTYDTSLSNSISKEQASRTMHQATLKGLKATDAQLHTELINKQTTQTNLQAQRAQVLADRKVLESKPKLTPAEKKKLTGLKRQNTALVKQLAKITRDINATHQSLTRVASSIQKEQRAIAQTTAEIADLTKLKSDLDTAYTNATAAHATKDAELLTDIVMNEARDEGTQSKEAIAYAYVNLQGGSVVAPKKHQISNFHTGVTEERFKRDSDKKQYIQNVTDSLNAVKTRLDDPSNKKDPTQGATHWVSPGALSKMGKPIPSWTKSMTPVIVPGIPAATFTFYR